MILKNNKTLVYETILSALLLGGVSISDGEVQMESFPLNFEEIKVTYTEYDSDGKRKGNV